MQISIDLPDGFLSVDDTENYKGVPVTVLRILGEEALFYTGKGETVGMSNADWEGIFKTRIAAILGRLLLAESKWISGDWQEENWTGRELNEPGPINFVREEY